MTDTPFLAGKDIYLRPLVESDCDGPYPSWFNDIEACRGNSHHLFPYTREAAREYVRQSIAARNKLVLAVIRAKDNEHIGNITLDNINYINWAALTLRFLVERPNGFDVNLTRFIRDIKC